MKKHLLGLAIFSFIFAAFAVAFAYFYAPKFQKVEEIRQPVFETDTHNRCQKKSENVKFEVISTQFDLDKKKLISQIRMKLDSYSKVPTQIFVVTNLYRMDSEFDVKKFNATDIKLETFDIRKDTNEAVFYIESDINNNREMNSKENLYVIFEFKANYLDELNSRDNFFRTEQQSVLFVHGEDSIIKK